MSKKKNKNEIESEEEPKEDELYINENDPLEIQMRDLLVMYGDNEPSELIVKDTGKGLMVENMLFFISDEKKINVSFSLNCPSDIVARFICDVKNLKMDPDINPLEPFFIKDGKILFGDDAKSAFYDYMKDIILNEYHEDQDMRKSGKVFPIIGNC